MLAVLAVAARVCNEPRHPRWRELPRLYPALFSELLQDPLIKLTACSSSIFSDWSAPLHCVRRADNPAYLTNFSSHMLWQSSVSVLTVSVAELDKGDLSSSCAEGM